jgi:molecular chaperone GrpE
VASIDPSETREEGRPVEDEPAPLGGPAEEDASAEEELEDATTRGGGQAERSPVETEDDAGSAEGDAAVLVDEPLPAPTDVIDPEPPVVDAAGVDSPTDGPEELREERDRYLELAKRTQADFENYRKRAARDVSAAKERATAGLARDLLPAIDNLERALASAEPGDSGLAHGVQLVHSELLGVLERSGVKGFDPAGERFDPNVHEALSTRPEEGQEAGVVLDVAQRGYRLGDTVIRPARVVVSA